MTDPQYETITTEDSHSYRAAHYQWQAPSNLTTWHLHPEYELVYLIDVQGTLFVGDSITRAEPGSIVLVGPNVPHALREDNHPEKENESTVIHFSADLMNLVLPDIPEIKSLKKFLDTSGRGLLFPRESVTSNIITSVSEIRNEAGVTGITALLRLLDGLSRTGTCLQLTSQEYEADNSDFNGKRMAKVVEYVRENLHKDIVQSNIAHELEMKPASFSRFFKKTTGGTFISFVNRMRTSEACRMLSSGDQDITDIAFSCGYSNISNFNRHFRDIRGMTPSQYRSQQRDIP